MFGGLLGHLGGSTGAGGWAWAEAVGWGCGWGLGLRGLVRLSTKASIKDVPQTSKNRRMDGCGAPRPHSFLALANFLLASQ